MIAAQSVVAPDAVIGRDVTVGPFCVVGIDGAAPSTRLGPGGLLRSHVVIYRGVVAGAGLHVGHQVLIREHTTIGSGVSIGSGSVIEHHVSIADDVRLHSRCFIPEYSVLEAGAWLGPGVILTNARYPNRPDTKQSLEGPRIGPRAVLGAGCIILPGVTVGAGALIGAGAVVTRDVSPGSTMKGNPARSTA